MSFEKLEWKVKSQYVAECVLHSIASGEYGIGDKLPPESRIAAEIGVSRTAVREALSALQLAKIIQRRAGDGTYVLKAGSEIGLISNAQIILETSESPIEAWEARTILEKGIIRLAIERAIAGDIEKLDSVLERMRGAAAKEDYDLYLKINNAFHLAIAKATRNEVLVQSLKSLLQIADQALSHMVSEEYVENFVEISIEKHRDMLTSIKERSKRKAIKAIERHFAELKNYL